MGSIARMMAATAIAALAAAPLVAQTAPPVPEKEKKICKAELSTGSLVARKKICKTRAQWDAERREAQAAATQMQEPRTSCGATDPGIC